MRIGDVIGERFAIEHLAASGGMGRIFRATDLATGSPVAIKVLLSTGAAEQARLAQEAQMLAELEHPAIVRYLSHGKTSEGDPFLAIEWLEGEDLQDRLKRERLTVDEGTRLLMRVAEALGAAHARGIIHRDIKPSNLFLVDGQVERVKVLDFGVAYASNLSRLTRSGMIVGTVGYMAPEQARGHTPLDARVDVFSLGCVLFECLTGVPAFAGDHLVPILAKVLFEDAPPLQELRSEIPGGLQALVQQMLSKEPGLRPRNGTQVAEALAALSMPTAGRDSAVTISTRPPALTRVERRALSIILIERPEILSEGETISLEANQRAAEDLREAAHLFGAELELLADGSAIATIAHTTMAMDLAAQAARCALALHHASGGRRVALVTGRSEAVGAVPVGELIDRAARLLTPRSPAAEREPMPAVVLDELTAALLDARFNVRETDSGFFLRGERELSEGARTLIGKPTACVGRDREIEMLEDLFAECVDESASQAALVTAAAGMGKSRLVHELLRRIRRRFPEALIWMGRGDSLRAGSPLSLLAEMLRSALGVRESEPLAQRCEQILLRTRALWPEAEALRMAELLGEIVGAPFPDENSPPLYAARRDAQLMGEHMLSAFRNLMAAQTAKQPLLIVLDDLHWGDGATVRFLDDALMHLKERSWMVLALGRPEVRELFPRLWTERGLHHVALRELSRRACERLVRQVLGDAASPATLERLVKQCDGNAFFLEELIRATVEQRDEALPETVVAMVEARLSRLDTEARRVLRAASVFGEVFWPGGVAALLGGEAQGATVSAALRDLCEQEVLARRQESRFSGEEELSFRHALLREGAYAMLTDSDRALGHRLAGAWLEAQGEQEPMTLAMHFERGGKLSRAAHHYLRAAQQAALGGDTEATILHAEQGLACGGTDDTRGALLGALSEVQMWKRQWEAALPSALEAMRLSPPGSRPWLQGALTRLSHASFSLDRNLFRSALSVLDRVEPSPESLFSMTALLGFAAVYSYSEGELERAETLAQRMHTLVAPVMEREPGAWGCLLSLEAFKETRLNDNPWLGLERAREARAYYQKANHPFLIANLESYEAMTLWLLGAFDEAERALKAVTRSDEEMGTSSTIRPMTQAGVFLDRGMHDEAHEAATKLFEFGRDRRYYLATGRGAWLLAEVLRRQGDLDGAERMACTAIEALTTSPLEQVPARTALASVVLARGHAAKALEIAEQAFASIASLGARACFRGSALRLVHAEALWASGERERAREAIAAARARLFAIVDTIGDVTLHKDFLEAIPENARTLELAQTWLSFHHEGG